MKYMNNLSVKNLAKRFEGVRAVDNLSFDIKRGIITGIIGPNGSGKTTLVNLLSGMVRFDSGIVYIGETGLSRIRPQDIKVYGVTRTFQDVRLFGQMSVLDNILVVLTERNVWSSLFEKHGSYHVEEAEKLLKVVGLWGKRNDLALNLSYGQRKLLEIARALAMKSDVYLFDEPFAGLFPEMVKIVSGILKELRASAKTVILIEHNMELIRELSDEVIVMDSGSLLAQGRPNEVLARRDVIDAYLGE